MHGSVDVNGGIELLKIGMAYVNPQPYLDENGYEFLFDAVEISLAGHIYSTRIDSGFGVQHVLIVEAAERLKIDIYQNMPQVVFSTEFLDNVDQSHIPRLHLRSARDWVDNSDP